MKSINKNIKICEEYLFYSLNYGKFRIIDSLNETGKSLKYLVEFENTKFKKWCYRPSIATGQIKDDEAEKNRVKNEYVFYENYTVLKIKETEFIIDNEDYDRCKNITWRVCNSGERTYCGGYSVDLGFISLHTFLMNFPSKVVDHIDRNTLDNRKQNLRACTYQDNTINASIPKDNTSGIIGVWIQKRSKIFPFVAELMLNRKKVYREYFTNKNDAIIGRLKAELKYFGEEFAPQRHLFKEYNII